MAFRNGWEFADLAECEDYHRTTSAPGKQTPPSALGSYSGQKE